jgi:hypothetical protein
VGVAALDDTGTQLLFRLVAAADELSRGLNRVRVASLITPAA